MQFMLKREIRYNFPPHLTTLNDGNELATGCKHKKQYSLANNKTLIIKETVNNPHKTRPPQVDNTGFGRQHRLR